MTIEMTNEIRNTHYSPSLPASTMVWPFNMEDWPTLCSPLYAKLYRKQRIEAAAPYRARAVAGKLSASEHLVYLLLKGRNPFRAFSPLSNASIQRSHRLCWNGLLTAAQEAASNLAYAGFDSPVTLVLARLLLLVRLRAMGLSLSGRANADSKALLREAMTLAPQGRSNVLEHCKSTARSFERVLGYLHGQGSAGLPVPTWMDEYRPQLATAGAQNKPLMLEYLGMHDCGKPFCLQFDDTPHYPDHALVSGVVWSMAGGAPRAACLMAQDMDLHTLKADGVAAFAKRPDAALLLLSGVASLHANAEDFGGADSDSFKIKFKRLQSRGQQICKQLFG